MKTNRLNLIVIVTLVLCLAAALPVLAQRPGPRYGQRALAQSGTSPDNLAQLKRALQAAGAPALTSDQESAINILITTFRSSHTPSTPNTAVQTARTALDTAILSGKSDDANAKIITDAATARFTDVANFSIGVVQDLNADQITALVTKFGTDRTVRLLQSLAGGPGFGPGPRQGAMGGRP